MEEPVKDDENSIFKTRSFRTSLIQDFGKYETRLLLITQIGYIPVAASMLLTTFAEPSEHFCTFVTSSGFDVKHAFMNNYSNEFYSLSVEFNKSCKSSSGQVTTFLSSLLMWGALIGSFCCGCLSDAYGRKPVFAGCLAAISVINFLLCFSTFLSWITVACFLLILVFFCGGYMVTNFVLLTEALELSRSRLLAVSLNGWSISMAITSFLAWSTRHWFAYHSVIALIGLIITFVAKFFTLESCRWLSAKNQKLQARNNAMAINQINGKDLVENDVIEWYELLGFPAPMRCASSGKWTTLFTSRKLLKPTLVMFYCFAASSIVSFGFYFSLDVLPGDRYTNLACMGLFKFALGFTPFWLSNFLSKKTIATLSVGLCCISALLIFPIEILAKNNIGWIVSILSVIVGAGMDPTWKINHLYSTELFPTSVRSMGRGVCNVGGRLGSVIAPMIVYLRSYDSAYPFIVFAVLLVVQWFIVICFLPNDNDREANEMDED
ncbi:unnamed protein product [Caenorhabditis bovis]|uniref:Major facilitator superfamily (MFS) profile domain-containing protein n=1 Tax=Caenorhabditis bovis TaxID=2654633 RepID=A0A8S1F8D7_9PELO|nr:unnamed protein product [Caenorhabditis bovis]